MGECKTEMKRSDSNKSKSGSWFKRKKEPMIIAETFTDHLDICKETIDRLVEIKTKDLKNEKGSEAENKLKLYCLRQMQRNIDSVVTSADEYADI